MMVPKQSDGERIFFIKNSDGVTIFESPSFDECASFAKLKALNQEQIQSRRSEKNYAAAALVWIGIAILVFWTSETISHVAGKHANSIWSILSEPYSWLILMLFTPVVATAMIAVGLKISGKD